MGEYKDRSIETIQKDVENNFKKIDRRGTRDDLEITQAGIQIC